MSITFTWNNPNVELYTPEETVIYRSETPFETTELPAPLETFNTVITTYTDDNVVDGIKYYYRISFKLGIKEEFSRLFEITAPTEPDLFASEIISSGCYFYNENQGADYGHQFVVFSTPNAIYPDFVGKGNAAGHLDSNYTGGMQQIMFRLAMMVAILRHKRTVWDTEGFTLVAPVDTELSIWVSSRASDNQAYSDNYATGIPAGSFITWHQAFDMLGRIVCCNDIIFNVFVELKPSIAQSMIWSRGVPMLTLDATRLMITYLQQFSQAYGIYTTGMPRGLRQIAPDGVTTYNITHAIYNTNPLESYLRAILEVFRHYPEIEQAMLIDDMSRPITYTNAALETVNWSVQGSNDTYRIDPLQTLIGSVTAAQSNPANQSPRGAGWNADMTLPGNHYGISGFAHTHGNWGMGDNQPAFYKCPTNNGKEFIAMISGGLHGGRIRDNVGQLWAQVSSANNTYTKDLSTTDPLESLVVLRYLPHLGLVDQSSRGTIMSFLGTEVYENHLIASQECEGFPEYALAARGVAPANIGTIFTDLDLASYCKAGTSWTAEMFVTNIYNPTSYGGNNNTYNTLMCMGTQASGSRFMGIHHQARSINGYICGRAPLINSNYSDQGQRYEGNRGILNATRAGRGMTDARTHVVVQYDAIENNVEVFCNGVMISRWQPTLAAAPAGMFLTFFGQQNSLSDLTTQRQITMFGLMQGDIAIHEIVVTLAKRYNYDHFIGQVPFARKRFTA